MKLKKITSVFLLIISMLMINIGFGQSLSIDQMKFLTHQWEGERFDDGRPKVAADIIERMKKVTIEEAWGVLRNEGYHNQFEGDWQPLHDDVTVVGRALTVQYMPNRPDVEDQIKQKGLKAGEIGNTNSWPIDRLVEHDVYVADGFGKIVDGTLIGDNLGIPFMPNPKLVLYSMPQAETWKACRKSMGLMLLLGLGTPLFLQKLCS